MMGTESVGATGELTKAEAIFRQWMRISVLMYAVAVPIFFFGGAYILRILNAVSSAVLPLPLYPLPASGMEGSFWRVLGVSMMAMLTWACWSIYREPRQHLWLARIVLVSKSCSTACYLWLFVFNHYFVYLVGAVTDAPIFLLTLALWYLAAPGLNFLDKAEENILTAVGDALLAPAGMFPLKYSDAREQNLAQARILLAGHDFMTLLFVRLCLRFMNWAPVLMRHSRRPFCSLPLSSQEAFLSKMEKSRWSALRLLVVPVKMYAMLPFFEHPDMARAVGYVLVGKDKGLEPLVSSDVPGEVTP